MPLPDGYYFNMKGREDFVDSATVDPTHAALKAQGYCFWSNILNNPAGIEASKRKIEAEERTTDIEAEERTTDIVVNPRAYDCCGRPVQSCVSIWRRRVAK